MRKKKKTIKKDYYQAGGNVNTTGFTIGTPTAQNPYNIIPSQHITMDNTDQKIIGAGLDQWGNLVQMQFMPPDSGDYNFNKANQVFEVPTYQAGGLLPNLNLNQSMTFEQEQRTHAPQQPVKRILYNVQTNETKDGLPAGNYTKVEYNTGNVDYLDAAGLQDFQRMNNYRIFMENQAKKPPVLPPTYQAGGKVGSTPVLPPQYGVEAMFPIVYMEKGMRPEVGEGYNAYFKAPNDPTFNPESDVIFYTQDEFNMKKSMTQPSSMAAGEYDPNLNRYLKKTQGGLNKVVKYQGGGQSDSVNYMNMTGFPDINQILQGQAYTPQQDFSQVQQPMQNFNALTPQRQQLTPAQDLTINSLAPSTTTPLQPTTEESMAELNRVGQTQTDERAAWENNDKIQFFNPYGGGDPNATLQMGAYNLGKGNKLAGFAGIGAGLLGTARQGIGAYAAGKRNDWVEDEMRRKTREAQTRAGLTYAQAGAEIPQRQDQMGLQIASALQAGTDPNQIIESLISQGIPQEQATQLVQGIIQQMQGQEQFRDGGEKKKLIQNLTGEYTTETGGENFNAEIEGGEYVQKPDGNVTQAIGDKHSQGGIGVNLPAGTRIVSDHLKLGKDLANHYKKNFDLEVKAGDTFATVLDKFTKKSGLAKIVEEQEEIIKEMDEQQKIPVDNPNATTTVNLNLEFLGEKMAELEQKKIPLEEIRSKLLDDVFEKQEKTKPVEERAESVFADGGTIGEKPKKSIGYGENTNRTNIREQQKAREKGAYGNIEDTQKAIEELYKNFPDLVESNLQGYVTFDSKGNIKVSPDIPLNKTQEVVNNLQRAMDTRMKESASIILSNPNDFDEDALKEAQRYLAEETFLEDAPTKYKEDQAKAIRGYDSKLGNFTAGRYAMSMNLVTPEERQLLASNRITSIRQLKDSPLKSQLSPQSLKNVEDVEAKIGNTNADFTIGEYVPDKASETSVTKDKAKLDVRAQGTQYQMLNLPNQNPMLPDSMSPHTLLDVRPQLVEAPQLSPEQQIAENRRSTSAYMQALQNAPDSQSAAGLAQLQANELAQNSRAIQETNRANILSEADAERFNAQSQYQADLQNNQYLSNFEQLQLTAKAKTDANIRNYFNQLQKINLTNYNAVQGANLTNALYDDFQMDGMGNIIRSSDNPVFLNPAEVPQSLNTQKKTINKKKRFGGKI